MTRVLIFVMWMPSLAMAEPTFDCRGAESTARQYFVWKADFETLRVEAQTQSEDSQFTKTRRSLRELLKVAHVAVAQAPNKSFAKVIAQSDDLLVDLDAGYFAEGFAIRRMQGEMSKIEEIMDELVRLKQVENASCSQVDATLAPSVLPAAAR